VIILGRPKGAKNKPKNIPKGRPVGVKHVSTNTEVSKKICTACGKLQTSKNFYNTPSVLFKHDGLVCICKDCVGLLFDSYMRKHDSYKKSMYYTCRKLDIPFSMSCYNGGESHAQKADWAIWQGYMKQLNSFRDNNGYGMCFDDSDDLVDDNEICDSLLADSEIDASMKDFKVTPELIINGRICLNVIFCF